MIYALFAVGYDGSFGTKNGALPWGSFKEELEQFYTVLKENRNDLIVVGKTTYESAPKRLREALDARTVYVMGRGMPELRSKNHRWMPQVGSSFKRMMEHGSIDVLVIGGKATLEHFNALGMFDALIRSTIMPKSGVMPEADVYLDFSLATEIPMDATITVVGTGENENYRYVQDLIFF